MKFMQKLLIGITLIGTVTATALGWVKLPKRVDKIEQETENVKKDMQETKHQTETYQKVNEEWKTQLMRQQEILIDFIKETKDK